MRRVLIVVVAVTSLASVACGAKKPPRVQPTPAPSPAPPPLLAAAPIAGIALAWPPAVASLQLSWLFEEFPEPRPSRVGSQRERPAGAPPLTPPSAAPPDPLRLATPGTPDEAVATRQVREQLDRARRALGG